METYMIVFAMVGMTIGALGFLGGVGGLLYMIFFRGKGNPTPAMPSGAAAGPNHRSGSGPA